VAWFSVEGRQCEVVTLDAAPAGREVLGTFAVGGRDYVVLTAEPAPDTPDLLELLTPRELEIALLVSGGWDAKAIGRRLDISFHTVRVHTGRIYAKLRMHKQSELVACVAKQWRLPQAPKANGQSGLACACVAKQWRLPQAPKANGQSGLACACACGRT
jgi:DNA-binding CsgD family transcriptional regulator